ncbi:hypothetical protein D3C71_1892370 [compost metagenome]
MLKVPKAGTQDTDHHADPAKVQCHQQQAGDEQQGIGIHRNTQCQRQQNEHRNIMGKVDQMPAQQLHRMNPQRQVHVANDGCLAPIQAA